MSSFHHDHKTKWFLLAVILTFLLLIWGCSLVGTGTKTNVPVNLDAGPPGNAETTTTSKTAPVVTTPLAAASVEPSESTGDDTGYWEENPDLPDPGIVNQPIDPIIDPPVRFPPITPATLFSIVSGLDPLWSSGSGPLEPGEWSSHGAAGRGVWLGGDAFDFDLPAGTLVFAAHDGIVTYVGYERYGVTIIEGEGFKTCYAHVEPIFAVGDYISSGQLLGTVAYGSDGWFQQLHFELIDNGEPIPAGDYPMYF